jgi:hypothetical protein
MTDITVDLCGSGFSLRVGAVVAREDKVLLCGSRRRIGGFCLGEGSRQTRLLWTHLYES